MFSFADLVADLQRMDQAAPAVLRFIETVAGQMRMSVANGNLSEVKELSERLFEHRENLASAMTTTPQPLPMDAAPAPTPPIPSASTQPSPGYTPTWSSQPMSSTSAAMPEQAGFTGNRPIPVAGGSSVSSGGYEGDEYPEPPAHMPEPVPGTGTPVSSGDETHGG